MIYKINETVCKKNGLSLAELLTLLLLKTGVNIKEVLAGLEQTNKIIKDEFDSYLITQRWDDVMSTILLDSEEDKKPEEMLEKLAMDLMDIFPKGKKANTSQYWRGNKREIMLRLKKFFKLYGNAYSSEDILQAAKSYVDSFNGVYSYMRILKYFIWKDEKKPHEDGTIKIVETSELANYLENVGQEEEMAEDWTSTLK